jgi:hypothetical protein
MFCWAEAQKRRVGALSIQTQGNNFSSKLYNTLEKVGGNPLPSHQHLYESCVIWWPRSASLDSNNLINYTAGRSLFMEINIRHVIELF